MTGKTVFFYAQTVRTGNTVIFYCKKPFVSAFFPGAADHDSESISGWAGERIMTERLP